MHQQETKYNVIGSVRIVSIKAHNEVVFVFDPDGFFIGVIVIVKSSLSIRRHLTIRFKICFCDLSSS